MTSSISMDSLIAEFLNKTNGDDRETLERIILNLIPEEERQDYLDVKEGKKLPSLSSDIIAKRIFDPDFHSERLEALLKFAFPDEKIEIEGSFLNEGYMRSGNAKKVIFDIPARLLDGRLSDTEFQVSSQDYIIKRGELYGADMLMIQYSVEDGQKKSELDYNNVNGVLQLTLGAFEGVLLIEG